MDGMHTNSILGTIRKMVGADNYFDSDLIVHINTVFAKLNQLGVGPENGFEITDDTTQWTDYISDNISVLNMVKSYMEIQIKLLFDNSTASSYLINEWNKKSEEYEWRLNAAVDFTPKKEADMK